MEERFTVLETKIAYHDAELAEVSSVVFRQQRAIEALQAQLKRLTDQLKQLGFEGDTGDQKPPHY
jgi:uncharacterized coiled-coil protein SlyX